MEARHLLQQQLARIQILFHEITEDITSIEWISRVHPDTNLLGFTCWHISRTQDWILHTVIGGTAELAMDSRWAHWDPIVSLGVGVTISLKEADSIAHLTKKADVLTYADAVYDAMHEWLGRITDADLDIIPDIIGHHLTYPAYQRPSVQQALEDWTDRPIWRLLTTSCVSHARGHLGEIQLHKQLIRAFGTGAYQPSSSS